MSDFGIPIASNERFQVFAHQPNFKIEGQKVPIDDMLISKKASESLVIGDNTYSLYGLASTRNNELNGVGINRKTGKGVMVIQPDFPIEGIDIFRVP